MLEVTNEPSKRTIRLQISGFLREADLAAFAAKVRAAVDSYRGQPHLMLADMRGLKATTPEVAAVFGQEIGYGRSHGVVFCAHLSDSSITRLQAARIAREASPYDGAMLDVVSAEEAERVLEEKRRELPAVK